MINQESLSRLLECHDYWNNQLLPLYLRPLCCTQLSFTRDLRKRLFEKHHRILQKFFCNHSPSAFKVLASHYLDYYEIVCVNNGKHLMRRWWKGKRKKGRNEAIQLTVSSKKRMKVDFSDFFSSGRLRWMFRKEAEWRISDKHVCMITLSCVFSTKGSNRNKRGRERETKARMNLTSESNMLPPITQIPGESDSLTKIDDRLEWHIFLKTL